MLLLTETGVPVPEIFPLSCWPRNATALSPENPRPKRISGNFFGCGSSRPPGRWNAQAARCRVGTAVGGVTAAGATLPLYCCLRETAFSSPAVGFV